MIPSPSPCLGSSPRALVVGDRRSASMRSRMRTSRNGVRQQEALERLRSVGLAINHLEDLLLHALRHVVARCPIVSCATTLWVLVDVLLPVVAVAA